MVDSKTVKPGDTVWTGRFKYGSAGLGSAIVAKATPKQIKLEGPGTEAFGYRSTVSPEECYATKREALVVLREKLQAEIEIVSKTAEALIKRRDQIVEQIGLEPLP